jgi:glycosyltransferase involved in cell wall biosynthesis
MQIDVPLKCGGKRKDSIITAGSADQPLVTVVTAVLNGQPYIAGCLESVLRQDYPNIEHIVLDGGSTDGTLDVLEQYSDRIALWRSEPDKGIYDAWNKALAEARGEWICFLGSDDEFLPGAISAYMAQAAQHPMAEYLCSEARLLAASGKERVIGRPWNWQGFLRRMDVCHVGSMHKRTLFQQLGEFDPSYRIAGDYEFLLRPRSELRTAFLPAETVYVRAGGVCHSTRVIYESYRAKHETGGLSRLFAFLDLGRDLANYKARLVVRRILNRQAARNSVA